MKSVAATIFLIGANCLLVGCASVCGTEKRVGGVVETQRAVLKRIVGLRADPEVKARIEKDAVLAEQERVLIVALESVMASERVVSRAHCKSRECGGQSGKQ